jgi:hypothetical protein
VIDFADAFTEKMREKEPSYEIRGLLASDDRVYPLGTDTKVLSTIFELLVRPLVYEIARENGLLVREPDQQNYYPDFTLMQDESDNEKIAIDVKSTYRDISRRGTWRAGFTLGSYTSFLRNNTKNILFPYDQYTKDFIIGFIYTRTLIGEEHFFSLSDREQITCPYVDVEWFIQEKYRISGERAGSGNTTNIGSIIASSVEDFAAGNGPFADAGEEVFLDYWRNYGRTAATREYSNLSEYYAWKERNR